MDNLRCIVERITFMSEQNGFSVLRCKAKGYDDLVTVVGLLAGIHAGSVLTLQGNWKIDSKYGRQFSVEKWEETVPATVVGIEKYLGSGLVKGIGPAFAHRIVSAFGTDTLDVIDTTPNKLLAVPGIGKVRVERIRKSWAEQKDIKDIMVFLQGHEVSPSHAVKIYKTYGQDSISTVQGNPYRLADDIWGIGFKTADSIAQKLGFAHDCQPRIRSGLLYALNKLADAGHCYVTHDQLVEKAAQLLDITEETIEPVLEEMKQAQDVICEDEAIYLPPFYHAESGCAKSIQSLIAATPGKVMDMKKAGAALRSSSSIQYDSIQLDAIETALSSKMMVLTGGPGTGKTTTTNGIIAAYQDAGWEVLLAAPTGRAAKRMSEATGMEAKTIHRLLEYKPPEGYQRNEEKPLEGDVLILDECSMIDVILMHNLLKAIPSHMTLIMVGDTDQLPSVGAGNVLKDIIESGAVPVVRLERIFRQAQGSRIIMNAHRINKGKAIEVNNSKDSDFFFQPVKEPEDALASIIEFVSKRLPKYYNVDPVQDIQVLTPMQRGVIGAANLNQRLQEVLNPTSVCLKRGGIEYRLHDKVMQIKNNYDKEVFNGDIGTVTAVDLIEGELTITFDGRDVIYDRSELDEVVLAYATTIHKAQGSEYPIVVMPMMMSHYVMLQRDLLYTGVTRAKKTLVLVGNKKAVSYAIRNDKTVLRNTRLAERLAGKL